VASRAQKAPQHAAAPIKNPLRHVCRSGFRPLASICKAPGKEQIGATPKGIGHDDRSGLATRQLTTSMNSSSFDTSSRGSLCEPHGHNLDRGIGHVNADAMRGIFCQWDMATLACPSPSCQRRVFTLRVAEPACVFRLAGTRPGGRGTFLSRDKKVPKEARPAAPALRASLTPDYRSGRPLNSLRSDNATGHPRPDSLPLGGAEGIELRGLDGMAHSPCCQRASHQRCAALSRSGPAP
jgi:hypothetical protein